MNSVIQTTGAMVLCALMLLPAPVSAQGGCSDIVLSFIHLEPCRYRLHVDNASECYPFLRLLLEEGEFVSWTAAEQDGWTGELISPTELLLTHSGGFVPLGASSPVEMAVTADINLLVTILWDYNCDLGEGCAAAFPLMACTLPECCNCGDFSDLFIRGPQGAMSQPLMCGGPPLNIGCPAQDIGFTLTGFFQCAGEDCPPNTDIDWLLLAPDGGQVASGTTQSPWFALSLASANFTQAGLYTLTLTGHCGTQACPCVIEFLVESGCPDSCPCDLEELQANVEQGFASAFGSHSCRACFSPLGLSDCDEVEWLVDDLLGTPVGKSTGNEAFCYTFPAAGTYTIYMRVTRLRPDGTLCESFTKAQSVNVTCINRADCSESILMNPSFRAGAVAGGLSSGGISLGWQASWGEPTVLSGSAESHDGWTIELTGSLDDVNILSTAAPICLIKDTGMISMRYKIRHWGDPHENLNGKHIKDWKGKTIMYQGDSPGPNACDGQTCFELASFELTSPDSGWVEILIPYDLRESMLMENCGDPQTVSVYFAVYVTSLYSDNQGGDLTRARIEVDNICLDNQVVAVRNPGTAQSIHLFPNPTTGDMNLRFGTGTSKATQLQVLDLWGRVLQSTSLETGLVEYRLSLNELPSGIYFLQTLVEGQSTWIEKVVKQ